MDILLFLLTFFTTLSGASATPAITNAGTAGLAPQTNAQVATPAAAKDEVLICADDAANKRILGLLFENAQGRIQPVLLTDGSRTKEMEQAFTSFKNGLGKELAAVLREPRIMTMDKEMRVIGEAFPDGINASAVRNKLQMFEQDVQIVVYTDFVFSPFSHRDPTGVYFRNQFDIFTQTGANALFNKQAEANALMWMAYLSL